MTDRHPDPETLLDLALSDIDERGRDDLTRHLAVCQRCRAEYATIADAVDHVLVAAPQVDPPAGFSHAVLAAIGIGSGTAGAAPARRSARGRRRAVALVTVAAAVGLVMGVGGSVAVLHPRGQTSEVLADAGSPLLTPGGAAVGHVQESRHEGQPVLVVTMADGEPGASYACRLVLADGTRLPAGSWPLDGAGGGTWVITRPDTQVAGVEMVTDAGQTWATAEL